jgi:hypothetical protein
MSFVDRAARAYQAFRAPIAAPVRDAVKLRSMPTSAPGPRALKPKKGKRLERLAFDYRRWMPSDVEHALASANGAGELRQVAAIAAWVKSNPVVAGVLEGRTSTPWLPYGVKYSDAAAAWLQGTETERGWRERITDPAELEAINLDDYNAGFGGGVFIWNEQVGHPELQALDNAGFKYLPGENRWQYHGWSKVYDVEPGNGVWVLKTRVKNDPWRDGAWHKIAYSVIDALQATMQRSVWTHMFAMPTVLAKFPLGGSDIQKARFTESIIGASLRVIGATPGYDLDFKQATAEGSDTFKQAEDKLREDVSILAWGTTGLISGGSGFANSDLFERSRAAVLEKEARKEGTFENAQIWPVALGWAVRAGMLPRGAEQACIEYNAESPVVVQQKATAAKSLIDAGYTPEEAQRRVGLEKHSYAGKVLAAVPTPPPSPESLPEARDAAEPEPSYSETIAAQMNERGDQACPCDRKDSRYCPSCGVVRRQEIKDGQWAPVWMPVRRRTA